MHLLITRKMGCNETSASLWMHFCKLGQTGMLDSRAAVQRFLSRLKKSGDKKLQEIWRQGLKLGTSGIKITSIMQKVIIALYSDCIWHIVPSFGLPSGKKDFDKLEQIKEKTINGARGEDAPGVASQLCLFSSLQLRQEHNGHSQLLNRELQGTRVTIFSEVHYRKVRDNQKVQKRSF